MTTNEAKYGKGDAVVSKKYGKGTVLSTESVEKPSDGDHTFYVVKMNDGSTRNLKAAELSAGKEV